MDSINKEVLGDLLHCMQYLENSGKTLQEIFTTKNLAKVMHIKAELQNFRKGGISLIEYIQIKYLR
ncbi:unnamed protein product [Citrullus colocynthis]|uniref:Uncharacterized protein n=1 Tax=Citrullus colocynthis TaxID=252529 RepID=A0ABP0YQS2_9ROSI